MTTRAGMRMLAEEWDNFDLRPWGSLAEHVAAIEAEAAARERERIREAVEALRVSAKKAGALAENDYLQGFRASRNETVAAVLRIIEGEMS